MEEAATLAIDPILLGAVIILIVIGAVVIYMRSRSGVTVVSAAPHRGTEPPADVATLLARGNKIGAIKLVREQTGLGLKEAKEYVEVLERGQTPPPITIAGGTADTVESLLARGNKIGAIKLVREQTGLGLKEAKEYVDDLEVRLKHGS
ncbi:MAG TPA: ribosomal protein L7/L12 [Roseiflexaceae bacterium]|nr:ribosomal protein L7/L12 [Roseiflexaceae bacterium]